MYRRGRAERQEKRFSYIVVGASGTYPRRRLMPRIAAFCSSFVVPNSFTPRVLRSSSARSFVARAMPFARSTRATPVEFVYAVTLCYVMHLFMGPKLRVV